MLISQHVFTFVMEQPHRCSDRRDQCKSKTETTQDQHESREQRREPRKSSEQLQKCAESHSSITEHIQGGDVFGMRQLFEQGMHHNKHHHTGCKKDYSDYQVHQREHCCFLSLQDLVYCPKLKSLPLQQVNDAIERLCF